jgi:hypothetical protein
VRAAGIDYQKVQKNRYNWWTKKRIVTEIRELNRQGVSLSGGSIFKSHQNLAHGAMRKFGSWGQAVEAAGISYRKHLKTWSTKFWLRTMSDDRYNQMLSDAQRYAQRRQKRRRKKK